MGYIGLTEGKHQKCAQIVVEAIAKKNCHYLTSENMSPKFA